MSDQIKIEFDINDLVCPVTAEFFEDPITLTCCGKTISRDPMATWLQTKKACPLCNKPLSDFNVMTCPTSSNIAYMVEQAKKSGVLVPAKPEHLFDPEEKKSTSEWTAKLHCLCNNSNSKNQTVIGQLELQSKKSLGFKTLLIPVLDKSGSMTGSPTTQCQYSINRIIDLTYQHSYLVTNIITYSDNAENIFVDTSLPLENYRTIVNNMKAGGGTSFASAFNKIVSVCKDNSENNTNSLVSGAFNKVLNTHKNNSNISSVVIIFLTDGEDSSVPKNLRGGLAELLKHNIEQVWKKQYVIHTVGFGGAHDFDFLNSLRQIGTSEGAYRYADPKEDSDSLSNKINSLLDVIVKSRVAPLTITKYDNLPFNDAPVISGENGKYWLNLTKTNLVASHSIHVSVNNAEPFEVPIVIAEDQNDPEIWNQWYSYLTDCIASEVLLLSEKKENTLDKQIHCELLEQRINSIFTRASSTSSTYSRLESLLESVQTIKAGGSVDKLKLNDMKFEGKFATTKSVKKAAVVTVPDKIHYSYTPAVAPVGSWNTINIKRQKRVNSSKDSKKFLIVFGIYNNTNAQEWITENVNYIKHETDDNGANPIAVASSIGRCKLVEQLLSTHVFNVNDVDSRGYTALDLAILYGYWTTTEILINAGAKTNINGETLLRTCLSNKYVKTASLIVKHKIATVTDELVNASPNSEIAVWLSNKNNKEITVEIAIEKGIYDTVEEKLSQIKYISWEPYSEIFTKPTPDHIRIIDLLLRNKKADPIEVLCFDDEGEAGITWPLFMACEKGQDALFDTLMQYYTPEMLNKQNHKGTTALWIASCNRHTDIVMKLLDKGANPNISNQKGDGPLIPACQKGATVIVDMFLDNGAKLDCYNKNRDGPILICCRAGQPKILETLLKRLSKEEVLVLLDTSAEIDGFVPIMASTELDNVECIKVCHKYGASLETRTDDSNKIIQGATPLHLACFYGRLASVSALYEMGANMVSQTTVHGYTPLHIAIRQGHIKIVRYLLSLEKARPSMEMTDTNGRLPAYYANIAGNEQILEEFFTNKLALSLTKVLVSDIETEKRCSDVLEKYGRSLGCYEYDNVTGINIGDGSTIGTYAMLNGNEHLMQTLLKMGIDMQKSDDFGVTPEFWAKYLGYDMPSGQLALESGNDNNTKLSEMLENVANVSKKSTQNKIILALAPAKLQLLEGGTSENPIVKMSDGYGFKIPSGTIVSLRGSHALEHSLLGFIDKLKNNKVFPDGEQCLKYITFDAKVNVIKRIAAGEKTLQPNHMMALYLYTSNYTIFKQVNLTLKNWNSPSIWHPFINCLYGAINLLPAYVGEVYRAVNSKFTLEEYAVGSKITWNSFSLGSHEWKNSSDLINKKTGIVFIIHGKSGRIISKYSKYPVDAEVMFLPGTNFTVTNHYIADQICLGQANIRNTTFKMKENDYVKPLNGDAAIIVELTEN